MDDLLIIKVGRVPNDRTGDDLRTASQKANANFGALRSGVAVAQAAASAALQGVAGGAILLTAATRIRPSTFVVRFGDLVFPADPANMLHMGRGLGIVRAGGEEGDAVLVLQAGAIDGIVGAFSPGNPLFLAADGTLTATPPMPTGAASCWRQQIRTAGEDGTMIIRLGFAYAVSGSNSPVVIAGVPSAQTAFNAVIGDLFRGWALTLPALPSDGASLAAGWYRNGDETGFSLTNIA